MAPPQSDSLGVFPATAPPPLEEDMERILWTEAEIASRVEELASEISHDLKGSAVPVAVVGVATGAFLFLADVVRRIALPVTVDFVRVESYGSGTESSGAPRISSDVKVDVEGKHVILVEDIVDTGNTLSCLIPHMKSKGARSVSVCTFLDKPVRRKVHVELVGDGKFYRGFECPDYFVVGYGMDFAEIYRNLPFIGVLKPENFLVNIGGLAVCGSQSLELRFLRHFSHGWRSHSFWGVILSKHEIMDTQCIRIV